MKNQSQDPDSLVPIGSKEHVGFVSDDVRKGILLVEDRIKAETLERTNYNNRSHNTILKGMGEIKSLQKGGGGYGAGLSLTSVNGNGVGCWHYLIVLLLIIHSWWLQPTPWKI